MTLRITIKSMILRITIKSMTVCITIKSMTLKITIKSMTLRIAIKHDTQNINKKHDTKRNYNNITFCMTFTILVLITMILVSMLSGICAEQRFCFIVMLSVLLLSDVTLCVIILIIIMLSIMALYFYFIKELTIYPKFCYITSCSKLSSLLLYLISL